MLFFIYGENSYLCRRVLKNFIARFSRGGGTIRHFFYTNQKRDNFSSWEEDLRQNCLWGSGEQLFVLMSPFANAPLQNFVLQIAQRHERGKNINILCYEEGSLDPENTLFVFLKKNAKCYECKDPKGKQLSAWIEKQAKEFGASLSPAAVAQLAWLYGADLWGLENEIKKLAAFAGGRLITQDHIAKMGMPQLRATIFQCIDAVAEKNLKTAFAFLRRKIEEGEDPLRLLNVLTAQFRRIILLHEALSRSENMKKIQKEWKIHPYVLQKTLHQARHFSQEELKKIYHALFVADRKIKTGGDTPEGAFEDFLLDFAAVVTKPKRFV